MSYTIEYLGTVRNRDIHSLLKTAKTQIKKAIESRLTTEPIKFGKPLRFNLIGLRRIRVSDYRVIYQINDKEKIVTITQIGHRKNIYD